MLSFRSLIGTDTKANIVVIIFIMGHTPLTLTTTEGMSAVVIFPLLYPDLTSSSFHNQQKLLPLYCAVWITSSITPTILCILRPFHLFLFIYLFIYLFIFIVVQLQLSAFSPHPSIPPQPVPPPSLASTLPLGFVLVSFIGVPENPSPHYPLPTPLWLLLDCSLTFNWNIINKRKKQTKYNQRH